MNRSGWLTFIAVAAGALWACGEDAAAPTAAAPAPKPRAQAADAGVAAARPQYVYSYSTIGKRDPFRNFAETFGPKEGPKEVKIDDCQEILCGFDLDDLRVVAVVSGDANPVAMLEDALGTGHIVHRNTKIGKQGGKVTAIERECLVVTSYVAGADGKAQPNKVKMCIKADETAKPPVDLLIGK